MRIIELRDARIAALVAALQGLERIMTKRGGYMPMDEQSALMDARFALEMPVHGKTWKDRL